MTSAACTIEFGGALRSPWRPGAVHARCHRPAFSRRVGRPRTCATRAAAAESDGPYVGRFGMWTIQPEDKVEVWTYRASISVVAAAFGAGTLAALAPGDASWAAALRDGGTLLAALGGGGMAAATALIHIYVAPLKRLLQALLAGGAVGAAYLAATHPDVPLPAWVAEHPSAVWLVGPAFASLTGICFKEGFCYGKQESFALTLLIPAWLLGHLSGVVPEAGERGLAAAIAALLALFAARKYTQPVKDDIGDKSVFEFLKLDEEGQKRRIAELQQQGFTFGEDEA